jgi:hypothetical protein
LIKGSKVLNAENITPLKKEILNLKNSNIELSQQEIADELECSQRYVSEVLQTYGLDREATNNYQKNRVAILRGLQARILSSITSADIQKASLQQKVTAVGIIHDKERELEGFGREAMPMVVINSLTVNPVEGKQAASPVIDVTPENVGK